MKRFAMLTAVIGFAIVCVLTRPTTSKPQVKIFTQAEEEHFKWLGERLQEANSIKVGMSRADLLKVFEITGGITFFPSEERFQLRSCPLIKVEVQYQHLKGTSHTNLPPDTDRKISVISRPFLDWSYQD